jgi:MFS family permease
LCLLNMVVMRGINGAFSVYYLALLETFGWSHTDGASVASANFVVYALAAPFVGLAFDRFGPRILMPFGGVLVGGGLLLTSFATSLWDLYVAYGVVTAIGQGALGFVGHTALISSWFVRRRATAIGIASMGQGLGALVMVPTSQYLIDHIGWRSAYTVTAATLLLAVVPANALFQRRRPQDIGQFPDGGPAASEPAEASRKPSEGRNWTLGDAARAWPFWCIVMGHFALGTAVFMIATHIVAHYVFLGYERLTAAFIAGLIGFVRIGGTLLWGFVSDRLSRGKAYWLATLVACAGITGFIATPIGAPVWFAYLSAILFSLGHSAGTPTYGAVISDIFSGRRLGLIFGCLEVSFGLGSAFGAWIGGFLFDLNGSYTTAFFVCLSCFAVSAIAIHSALRWQVGRGG